LCSNGVSTGDASSYVLLHHSTPPACVKYINKQPIAASSMRTNALK
jgi:hypothetical protein